MDGESQKVEKITSSKQRKPRRTVFDKPYNDYVAKGKWICEDVSSPTGAHHWVQRNYPIESGLNMHEMPFICKYCFEAKKFPAHYEISSWFGNNKETSSQRQERLKKKALASHEVNKFTRHPNQTMGIKRSGRGKG